MKTSALLLLLFVFGCSKTETITLDEHAGVYTAESTDGQWFAAVRLNACPPYGYLTGYVYTSKAAATKSAAAGVVKGNNAKTLAGWVEYTDPLSETHANSLSSDEKVSDDPAGTLFSTEYSGPASFVGAELHLTFGDFQEFTFYSK